MAFNAGSIVATLKLDAKQFTAGLKTATKDTAAFAGSLKSAGGLATLALGGGVLYAANQLKHFAGQAYAAAAAGAKLIVAENAFRNLASTSGISADKLLADTRRITGDLTRGEIAQAANRLELIGAGMEKLPELALVAEAASKSMGLTVGGVLDMLTNGVARQNSRFLAQIGLIIDAEEANKRYAAQLRITTKELTEEQQITAYLNELLRQAPTYIDRIGASANDADDKVSKLGTSLRDLGDNGKMVIAEVFSPWMEQIGKQIEHVVRLIEKLESLKRTIKGFGAGAYGRIMGGGEATFPPSGLTVENPQMPTPTTPEQWSNVRNQGPVVAAMTAIERLRLKAVEAIVNQRLSARNTSPSTYGGWGPGIPLHTSGWGAMPSIPQGEVPQPDLIIGETTEAFDSLGLAAENAQDTVLGFFADLASGSASAAEALKGNLLRAIGAIANSMGNLLINAARGIGALAGLNPIAAAIAGFALLALSGLATGAGQGGSRVPEYRQPTPRTVVAANAGPSVTIHVDNFVGDKFWLNEFSRKMNEHLKHSGHTEVFFTE